MTDTESISKVTDIINDSRIGMLTTINEEGALVSRPLAVQEVKDDGDMWFFTGLGTSQVAHVRADPRVNVSFGKNTEWVSVAGTAQVVTDREKIREMWNQAVEAWFPDGPAHRGPDHGSGACGCACRSLSGFQRTADGVSRAGK